MSTESLEAWDIICLMFFIYFNLIIRICIIYSLKFLVLKNTGNRGLPARVNS
jgi:hypothetical protein